MLNELRDLADFLAGVRGRRKALVLFSEGIDYPINDAFTGNQSSDVRVATREAIAAAARSNVSFFTVDPRGLVGMSTEAIELKGLPEDNSLGLNTQGLLDEMRVSQDSLRTLADQTGGFAAVNANNLTESFARIVQANSTYLCARLLPPNASKGRQVSPDRRSPHPTGPARGGTEGLCGAARQGAATQGCCARQGRSGGGERKRR